METSHYLKTPLPYLLTFALTSRFPGQKESCKKCLAAKRVMGICLHYEAGAINHDRHFIPLKDGVMDTAISLLCHSLETGGQRSGFSCHFGGWEMAWSGQCFPHPVSPHA